MDIAVFIAVFIVVFVTIFVTVFGRAARAQDEVRHVRETICEAHGDEDNDVGEGSDSDGNLGDMFDVAATL